MAGEEVEYAQSLSRLLDVCTTTAPGAPARDAAAREVENLSRRRSIAFEVDGAVLRVDGGAAVPFDTLGTETLVTAVLSLRGDVGRALAAALLSLVVVGLAWSAATRQGRARVVAGVLAVAGLAEVFVFDEPSK